MLQCFIHIWGFLSLTHSSIFMVAIASAFILFLFLPLSFSPFTSLHLNFMMEMQKSNFIFLSFTIFFSPRWLSFFHYKVSQLHDFFHSFFSDSLECKLRLREHRNLSLSLSYLLTLLKYAYWSKPFAINSIRKDLYWMLPFFMEHECNCTKEKKKIVIRNAFTLQKNKKKIFFFYIHLSLLNYWLKRKEEEELTQDWINILR